MSSKEPIEQIEKNDPWYTVDQVSASQRRRQRLVIADRVKFIVDVLEEWRDKTYRRRGEKRKLKLLDAGCGDGVLLRPLTQLDGFEVYGIDYNPIRVERAQENAPQAIVKEGNLTSMMSSGFESRYFGAIVMSQVLEHIAEDRLVLQLMAELLSESGVFILGVPNEGCLLGKVRNKVLQPSIARTTDHVNFYTEKAIVNKLNAAGFIVDRVERAGFFFPHEAISVCLTSWGGGYKIMQLAGRLVRSQVAGFHFVCHKGTSVVARQPCKPAEPPTSNFYPIYQEHARGGGDPTDRLTCPDCCNRILANGEGKLFCRSCDRTFGAGDSTPDLRPSRQGEHADIENRDCKLFDNIETLHERTSRLTGIGKIVRDWSLTKIEDTNFELLEPHLNGKRVLEIGSGRGYLTALISRTATVTALDISRGCLDYARKIGNFGNSVFAIQGNACSIPFESSTFDIVVASEVLEHLPDLNRAMVEINRVLKDGGIVAASVPNTILHLYPSVLLGHLILHGPQRIVRLLRRRVDDGPIYHRPFLPKQFRHLFEQNGFEVLSHRTTMFHFWHSPYMQLILCGERIHAKVARYLVNRLIEKTGAVLDREIPLVRWLGARQHILAQKPTSYQQGVW